MQFNLNDNSLLGNGIFNNGMAGRVKNVSVSVERRAADGNQNAPDVKFIFTDETGGSVNDGYYAFTPAANDGMKSKEQLDAENSKNARNKIARLLSIANALVPQGFVYPDTTGLNPTQIEDLLINVITTHGTPENKVNIFATYGRLTKPERYLRVRMFNFIEKAGTPDTATRLIVNPKDDNMNRLDPDAPTESPAMNGGGGFGGGFPTGGGFGSIPPAQGNTGDYWSKQ